MTYNLQANYRFKCIRCDQAIIHFLVMLFGISSMVGVNGIIVELPLLIDTAPEGWALPTYVIIVTQCASIGPVIYGCLHKCKCKLNESLFILCLMCLHIFAIGTLIFYESTKVLLIVTFFSALNSCFGSVLFMPYLRHFDHVYIISYFIGEGISGVLSSIVALIQSVEKHVQCNITVDNITESVSFTVFESRFSKQYYFLFLTLILVASLIAFLILRYSPFVESRKNNSNFLIQSKKQLVNYKQHSERDTTVNVWCVNETENIDHTSLRKESKTSNDTVTEKANNLSVLRKTYFYILLGIYCFFIIGFIPSIQSYACLPYGKFALQLVISCIQFAYPVAYFLVLWIVISNIKIINCLSLICLIAACYIMYLSLSSPTPPLQKSTIGVSLLVLSSIIVIGLTSYLRLVIVSLLKRVSPSKELFKIGIVIQLGATLGAILSFVLVNFTNLFKAYVSSSALSEEQYRTCVQ